MHLNLFTLALGVFLSLHLSVRSIAQDVFALDSTSIYTVQTKDGNVFYGAIVLENAEFIILSTETFGELTIKRKVIRNIRLLDRQKVVNGRAWFDNPYGSRYFAGTSGYGLRKGEGSYDNGWVVFNQVSYGLSDHFSLGAGFAPLLIFDGPLPMWITPKFSIPIKKDRINLAIGGLFGHSYSDYEFDNYQFGAVYSQLTFGSRDANLSVGFGFGISDGNWTENPLLSLNGMIRLSPRFALIGESYIINSEFDGFGLLGTGVRFMGRRVAVDLAMLTAIIPDDGVYPVPWVGLHVPFGKPNF